MMRPLQKPAILGFLLAVLALYPAAQEGVTGVPKRPGDAVALSPRGIAQAAFKSVVLLEMRDSNEQPLSLGSGFFISDGIIATNAHVIEGASGGTAKLIGEAHTLQILGTVAVDHHADLALLKVNSAAPSLVLGPITSPSVGDRVYVVGNPLGLEGTFSEGIISAVRKVDSDSILQMTAPISPGSSGGPVMDSSGAVIGVAVATFQYGQNLNLAVPVSYLSGLLASQAKDPIPLGDPKMSGRAANSVPDRVGTRIEAAVTVSDYQLENTGTYQFRLANKLPVGISDIQFLILYYDTAGSLLDFEKYAYPGSIPPGLTKTIVNEWGHSREAERAGRYYWSRNTDPKVEIRVLGFAEEKSE